AGAMRGYGAPQVTFALECLMDDAAAQLNIDPVDIRLRNAARSGDCNPVNKKTIYSAGLIECLKRGKELFGWDERKAEALATRGDIRRGVG
ncbi:molybdopterin-dependent oxidoreductase, partial [Klebsiella pneumoniae]|nr:molybdopterin-dependent oxidoreductase [Klebsiella pneumoniae]